MLGIITNEKERIERILNTKRIDEINPLSDVRLFTKYQINQGIDDSEVLYDSANNLMKDGFEGYNEVIWNDIIKKVIGSVKRYKNHNLICVDNIIITKSEWENIIALNNKQLERLAFITLCYAKVGNKVYSNSNNWVYVDYTNIFRESKIRMGVESYSLFNTLIKERQYLSKKNNAVAKGFKVDFLDENSEPFIIIDGFNDMDCITYYDEYKNNKKYKRCEICGKRFEIKSKTRTPKYCNKCQKEKQKEWDKESKSKKRKMSS